MAETLASAVKNLAGSIMVTDMRSPADFKGERISQTFLGRSFTGWNLSTLPSVLGIFFLPLMTQLVKASVYLACARAHTAGDSLIA